MNEQVRNLQSSEANHHKKKKNYKDLGLNLILKVLKYILILNWLWDCWKVCQTVQETSFKNDSITSNQKKKIYFQNNLSQKLEIKCDTKNLNKKPVRV